MKKNMYVENYRRKRYFKKMLIVLVLLIGVLMALLLNLPIFNVETFIIKNNSVISTEKIEKESGLQKGENIFHINLKKAGTNILNDPYISNVKIKRRIPNTLVIEVEERKAMFYFEYKGIYYITDLNGTVLEKISSLRDITLPKLEGIVLSKEPRLGENIDFKSSRKEDFIKEIFKLIESAKESLPIKSVNIEEEYNFKVNYNNIEIRVGNEENLRDKLNSALNIIRELKLSEKKGYIDVSDAKNPAINIED